MVVLRIISQIPHAKMTEFEQALDYIMHQDVMLKSSVYSGLYREWHADNTFLYIEEWKSVDDLKRHMEGKHFKSLLGAMKVLGEIIHTEIISSDRSYTLDHYMAGFNTHEKI
jgi:quinol monooxygenase YgiN